MADSVLDDLGRDADALITRLKAHLATREDDVMADTALFCAELDLGILIGRMMQLGPWEGDDARPLYPRSRSELGARDPAGLVSLADGERRDAQPGASEDGAG